LLAPLSSNAGSSEKEKSPPPPPTPTPTAAPTPAPPSSPSEATLPRRLPPSMPTTAGGGVPSGEAAAWGERNGVTLPPAADDDPGPPATLRMEPRPMADEDDARTRPSDLAATAGTAGRSGMSGSSWKSGTADGAAATPRAVPGLYVRRFATGSPTPASAGGRRRGGLPPLVPLLPPPPPPLLPRPLPAAAAEAEGDGEEAAGACTMLAKEAVKAGEGVTDDGAPAPGPPDTRSCDMAVGRSSPPRKAMVTCPSQATGVGVKVRVRNPLACCDAHPRPQEQPNACASFVAPARAGDTALPRPPSQAHVQQTP
jgi:hypothetical protein